MNDATCSVDGCGRPLFVKKQALCGPHYSKLWREQMLPCSAEGCPNRAANKTQTLCSAHLLRLRRAVKPPCSVDGCTNLADSTDMCGAHRLRVTRWGSPRPEVPLRGRPLPSGLLWCSSCEAEYPAADFYRNATTLTGYDGICKTCTQDRRQRQRTHRLAVAKAWRNRNRGRINERKRRDAAKVSREVMRERSRAWRAANPERVREQIRAQNQARYARLKSAAGKATPSQIKARWDYYGGKCWMCGAAATDVDHVKPLAVGGSNWPANLRPACSPCNRSKSARWPYVLEVARERRAA